MEPLEPSRRVLSELLGRQAEAHGDRPLLRVGELTMSYDALRRGTERLAGAFAAAGIGRGDRVGIMAENRVEVLEAFTACAWLGAILVPINTALRGGQLSHVLHDAGVRALALETAAFEQLDGVEQRPAELERLWLLDPDGPSAWGGLAASPFPEPGEPVPAAPSGPGDTVAILYTSGTTGPAKGVCCPNAQFYWWGVNTGGSLGVTEQDVLYTCLPLFHTNALNAFVQALVHGACFSLGPRFSASRFWQRVAAADATVTYLLGAMVSILMGRAPAAHDRAHSVRIALAPATPTELHGAFAERFGIHVVEAHGMTETNVAIGPRDGDQRPGTMGRVMPGFDAKVVDDEDSELPRGTAGELVLRADEPYAFATGYWRLPEQTVNAWRNLWFHTGDRVVCDEDGYFRFVDRTKDAIRRRGENISAWEVEQVLQGHPDVAAAAVIPVPSPLGEDDVMACVVPRPNVTLDPSELVAYCAPRLAYFAIPRYVDVLSDLPLTENGKVRKFVLRERGITESTWDREAIHESGVTSAS